MFDMLENGDKPSRFSCNMLLVCSDVTKFDSLFWSKEISRYEGALCYC